ncbi:hypothetical protein SAMN02745111_02323 [Eubacterium uniforme]|uniref:Uncharacterized protein n=1 Tax=Eubacterium uniforme TaxID=39495 RepID=A0A1T4W505_9FIRM|nr:hypothetical protein [Eubacterium uniforme]SKA72287.1 hypothetical protein SAMN02745111_02323 [Eubacterium uniforme]
MEILQTLGSYIVVIIMAIFGGLSSIAVVLGIIGTLIYKIYRKVKYGISLFD